MSKTNTLLYRALNRLGRIAKAHWQKFLFVPPVLVGLAVLGYAVATKKTPQQRPVKEIARTLSVASVIRRDVQPTVTGYGLARPAKIWRAVSRVDGAIIETHPRLKAGEMIVAETVLLRIDPTDYEIEIERLKAEIENQTAKMNELQQRKLNDEATLRVEIDSLELVTAEVERLRQLVSRMAASQSEFDKTRRDYLAQKRLVQSLENSLNLIPSQLEQADANLTVSRKRLHTAQRDLSRTIIKAPFDSRLASVNIEPGQYVATNEQLFEVHGVSCVEVEAKLSIEDVGKLASQNPRTVEAESMSLGDYYTTQSQSAISNDASVYSILQGLQATVRVRSGDWVREWPAKVVRIREQIERRTRAVGVVVAINLEVEDDGSLRPPLLEGTFCEVDFEGQNRPKELLVPTAALHDGRLFIVNEYDRLQAVKVLAKYRVGDETVIAANLTEGQRVVITNPTPAVDGTLVDPIFPPAARLAEVPSETTPVALMKAGVDGETER